MNGVLNSRSDALNPPPPPFVSLPSFLHQRWIISEELIANRGGTNYIGDLMLIQLDRALLTGKSERTL